MLNKVRLLNNFLSTRMFYISILAIVLGYLFPFYEPNPYAKFLNIALFALVTFFASVTLSSDDFFAVLKNPRIPIWLLFVVHVCAPILVYTLSILFYAHQAETRMGMLIGSIIPMGVSTIIWISIMGGNIAVSIVAITLDTLLAPFIIALFIKLFFKQAVDINYLQMLLEMMFMVTIPSIVGMLVHNFIAARPTTYQRVITAGALFSKLCMVAVIYIGVATVIPNITFDKNMIKMVFVIYLMVISSFLLGYLASLPIKNLDRGLFISILYNVGMRNINFGIVLAVGYFPAAVAIPVTLMVLFQQPTAAIVCQIINKLLKLRHAEV